MRTPPSSVNLMALPTRFKRICLSRVGSLWNTWGRALAYSTASVRRLSAARTRMSDSTSAMICTGEVGIFSTVTLPASILEMSSTSLTSDSRCSELRRMACTVFTRSLGGRGADRAAGRRIR